MKKALEYLDKNYPDWRKGNADIEAEEYYISNNLKPAKPFREIERKVAKEIFKELDEYIITKKGEERIRINLLEAYPKIKAKHCGGKDS